MLLPLVLVAAGGFFVYRMGAVAVSSSGIAVGGGQGYFEDDDTVEELEALLKEVGEDEVYGLNVYPGYAMVEVRDGDRKQKFQIRGGNVSEFGSGMPIIGKDPDEGLIDVDDIDVDELPDVVVAARAEVDDEDEEITMVTFSRPLVRGGDPQWKVHFDDGTILSFDTKGKLVGGQKNGKQLAGVSTNFFEKPEEAKKLLLAKFGDDVQVKSVNLYDFYAIAEVRDPKEPDNVDRYTIRDGAVGSGDPVRLTGSDKNLDACTTKLADVDFEQVVALSDKAGEKIGMGRQDMSHIIFHKFACRGSDFTFNFYFDDKRNSGFVVYDQNGTFKRKHK